MSVPNHSHVPKKLFETGLFNLKDHEGHHAFTDSTIATLNGIDSNWRHLKKKPGQTQIGGHGEDSGLYLHSDGTATAVDFIAGAGGPNPGPGWIVDTTVYKHSDAHDPDDHGIGSSAPQPPSTPSFPYPDENTAGKAFQVRVKQAYTDAGRLFPDPNDQDAFRHFMRFGYSSHEMDSKKAEDKHIAELRKDLGL